MIDWLSFPINLIKSFGYCLPRVVIQLTMDIKLIWFKINTIQLKTFFNFVAINVFPSTVTPLALKHCILTNNRLSKLEISNSFMCFMWGQEFESVDHLLLSCPFSSMSWFLVMNRLQCSFPLPSSLWDLPQSWPILYSESMFVELWIMDFHSCNYYLVNLVGEE